MPVKVCPTNAWHNRWRCRQVFVRYWGEQAVSIMCCMVCLMPQSQVSCSLETPHFNMFTLDRSACVRNRLSAFHVVRGFSAPAGRCSSAQMLRCTLASRGSSRSLHSSTRAAFAVVVMGLVHVVKLFRDLGCDTTPRCQLSGCLSSVACRVRSVRLLTRFNKIAIQGTPQMAVD